MTQRADFDVLPAKVCGSASHGHFVVQRRMATRKVDALLSTINTSLAKLRNDGTLKMIFARYAIDGTLVK
jgi:hypothetical protein